jgi:hypothetical protein
VHKVLRKEVFKGLLTLLAFHIGFPFLVEVDVVANIFHYRQKVIFGHIAFQDGKL